MIDLDLGAMNAEALEARLRASMGSEREALVEFLLHLGEFEARRLYERSGHATVWDYCRRTFGFMDSAIHYRTTAARLLRRFPQAVARLRDGRLCMTGLVLLRDVLSEANAESLFETVRERTKREIEELVAEMQAPKPAVPTTIRKVESAEPAVVDAPTLPALEIPIPVASADERTLAASSLPRAAHAKPIGGARFEIGITVSKSFLEKLERARALLSHAVPDADLEMVLTRALDALLEKQTKRRASSRPPAQETPPRGRHIPKHVEAVVRKRDDDRCSWGRPDGSRCGSTWKVEIDHIVPVAKGGKSTVENCRLLCRAHNQQWAREEFGEAWIERAKKRRRDSAGRVGALPIPGMEVKTGPPKRAVGS